MFEYPEEISAILQRLESGGFMAYLVGGCVRDHLNGQAPHDFDVTTDATPDEIINVFSDHTVIPTGIKHGTVTVIAGKTPVEITTFRTDGEYRDGRHPEKVLFSSSFREDASRRDFTMNAIAYSEKEGIVDPFGGKEDIEKKIIRTVGEPDRRFSEDALRILRAIRFSSVLGFEIESNTGAWVHKNRELLKSVSSERIFSEFIKLLCGKNVKNVLTEYADVIAVFIPEIKVAFGFDQHNFHHVHDVWQHTVHAVEAIAPAPHLRLAAFFHDVGKPETFSVDENGTGHFYGHSERSCEIARTALRRLRADGETLERVLRIIKYHDLQINEDEKSVKRALRKLSESGFYDLIAMYRADTKALAPEFASRSEHFDRLESTAKKIKEENGCFSLSSLALKGNDLIDLGIPKGKEIGLILDELLENVIAEKLENDKKVLTDYVKSKFSIKNH